MAIRKANVFGAGLSFLHFNVNSIIEEDSTKQQNLTLLNKYYSCCNILHLTSRKQANVFGAGLFHLNGNDCITEEDSTILLLLVVVVVVVVLLLLLLLLLLFMLQYCAPTRQKPIEGQINSTIISLNFYSLRESCSCSKYDLEQPKLSAFC